jgi:hypothetical protein
MGLRFAQKSHCEPDEAAAQTVKSVQNLILAELKWDFRVKDAYLQKVLTLVESGRQGREGHLAPEDIGRTEGGRRVGWHPCDGPLAGDRVLS